MRAGSAMSHQKHCISCGCVWGNGENIGTSGICPRCFAEWANGKKKIKGLRECYGEFGKYDDVDCSDCTIADLCIRDTYGIE